MAQYFEPSYQHQHQHFSHHEQMHRLSAHYADMQSYAMAQQIAIPTAPRTNETKPRLGKDEVDILEREFKKNPKPTTQTKRQFAEDMGVELARINNWFQNRRAKRKQEKKQEAYEAGQAQDALGQYSEPSSPDFNYGNGYFSDSHMLPVQQPTTAFGLQSGPPAPVAPYNPQYSDPSTASMESLHRTLEAAQAANEHDEYHNFVDHDSLNSFAGGSLVHDSANSDRAHFPSPDESIVHFDNAQYAYPSAFASNLYGNGTQSVTELQSPPQEHHTPTLFSAYPTSSEVEVSAPQAVTTFPSQLLTQFDGLPHHPNGNNSDSQSPENSSASTLALGFHDIAESDESVASPPAPSNPFRSPPPPMDIASRRKKVQHKPAALVADTLRRPSMGPRTVSHAEGFRRPMDSPVSSPMRRIVSAGGNRFVLSGRVSKSGVESAQRSPINLGNFPESFMEQNCHTIRLPPSLTAGSSLNSSLAPPTPMSPRGEMTLVKRETSRSTASPNEGSMNFVFNAGTGGFTTVEGDQNLASPPETPQAQMALHPSSNWPTMEFSEKQWSFDVPDEPLYTPALETFPMELHMPQPAYLTSMSQPVTPAFGQFNQNFMFAHDGDSPQYTLSTQPHSDYSFPDAHYMSPSMTKQKTFQFSHTTPADFSDK